MNDKEMELIERLHRDEQSAFREIYDQLYGGLYTYAYRLIHNREQAEEIVSDKLLVLWQKRHVFSRLADMKAYLSVAVRYACYDFLKSINKNRPLPLQVEELPDEQYSDLKDELISLMMAEIEKLSTREKEVMHLTLQGLTIEEIATQLKMAPKTVYNTRSAAFRKLRINLSGFIWIAALPLLEKLLRTCLLETSCAPQDLF